MNSKFSARSYRSFLCFSLMTAAMGACSKHSGPAASSLAEPSLATAKTASADACAAFRTKLPSDYFQELLEVPEDPANPDGEKTHVFYYGKITPGVTPVVFFNGGPGSDSHGSYRNFTSRSEMLDPNHDASFVYIDQRGNGCSDAYPQVADRKNPDPAVLQRLTHYGSTGIVFDAETIRKKLLGNKPWIAFGQSYGSFIVHRYLTLAAPSLKSGFAHANTITTDGYARIKNRVESQARIMDLYLAQYPDDASQLAILRSELTIDTCFKNQKDDKEEACGYDILEPLAADLLGFNNTWPELHAWINIMAQNGHVNRDGVAQFLKEYFFEAQNPQNDTYWAMKVINYVDRNVPPMDGFGCTKIKTDLAALTTKIDLDSVLLSECMSPLQWAEAHPKNIGNGTLPKVISSLAQDLLTIDALKTNLTSNPNTQFYWYSGHKDPYVPVEDYSEELTAIQTLPNVHYQTFSGTGHDGFYTEPKVWQDLISEIKRAPGDAPAATTLTSTAPVTTSESTNREPDSFTGSASAAPTTTEETSSQ